MGLLLLRQALRHRSEDCCQCRSHRADGTKVLVFWAPINLRSSPMLTSWRCNGLTESWSILNA